MEEATSLFIVCEKSIGYHLIQSPSPAHILFWGESKIGNLSGENTKDKVMEGKKKLADWWGAEGRIRGVWTMPLSRRCRGSVDLRVRMHLHLHVPHILSFLLLVVPSSSVASCFILTMLWLKDFLFLCEVRENNPGLFQSLISAFYFWGMTLEYHMSTICWMKSWRSWRLPLKEKREFTSDCFCHQEEIWKLENFKTNWSRFEPLSDERSFTVHTSGEWKFLIGLLGF